MITEKSYFLGFVACITALTTVRLVQRPSPLLVVCLVAQLLALCGLTFDFHNLTRMGHVAFTVMLWVGSFTSRTVESALIVFLATFTLITRHVLGHCMFAHARGSSDTNDARYDALYVLPILIVLSPLTTPYF